MPFLIDGHNVIAAPGDIDLDDPDDEAKLVMKLRAWSSRVQRKAIVIFDGGLPGGFSRTMSTVDIGVVFAARYHTNADRIIDERLRSSPDAPNWTVVSSDHEVLDRARAKGARTPHRPGVLARRSARAPPITGKTQARRHLGGPRSMTGSRSSQEPEPEPHPTPPPPPATLQPPIVPTHPKLRAAAPGPHRLPLPPRARSQTSSASTWRPILKPARHPRNLATSQHARSRAGYRSFTMTRIAPSPRPTSHRRPPSPPGQPPLWSPRLDRCPHRRSMPGSPSSVRPINARRIPSPTKPRPPQPARRGASAPSSPSTSRTSHPPRTMQHRSYQKKTWNCGVASSAMPS